MKESYAVRSDLIIELTNAFRKHHIIMPYPQQDIYLHNVIDDRVANKKNTAD